MGFYDPYFILVLGVWVKSICRFASFFIGSLLLFMALICLGRIPKHLEYVSQFCLRHLSLFFIPAWLAAWFYAEELGGNL